MNAMKCGLRSAGNLSEALLVPPGSHWAGFKTPRAGVANLRPAHMENLQYIHRYAHMYNLKYIHKYLKCIRRSTHTWKIWSLLTIISSVFTDLLTHVIWSLFTIISSVCTSISSVFKSLLSRVFSSLLKSHNMLQVCTWYNCSGFCSQVCSFSHAHMLTSFF